MFYFLNLVLVGPPLCNLGPGPFVIRPFVMGLFFTGSYLTCTCWCFVCSTVHRPQVFTDLYLFTYDFFFLPIFSAFVEIHEIINRILFRHPLAKWSSTRIYRIISSHAHRFQYSMLPIPYDARSYRPTSKCMSHWTPQPFIYWSRYVPNLVL